MHRVIEEGLESYLEGSRTPEFEGHLKTCEECRVEVESMLEISSLFADLKSAEPIEPAAGFAFKVIQQIGERRLTSFWNLFLEPAFGRRLVFASLLTLAVLGSYLVSRETEYGAGPITPETVMAIDQHHQAAGPVAANDRDMMLVTLTSYEP